MDSILHPHKSTSDRLLSNFLSSQKQLNNSLLTLLSHSHSSSSSLLAYVTSSPGIPNSIRRAVQHAAFEGPTSSSSPYSGHGAVDEESSRWNAYVGGLESWRKELKEVHGLEEELSQVKRDREILITRLIKATKSRPTKADLASAAREAGNGRMSSSGSVLSFNSDGSGTTAGGTGRGKRAHKLAEAQAEVLGCEEHLRGLEVQLETERSRVMKHGLMERFKAMEDVGRMWAKQAKLGMAELERTSGDRSMDPYSFELGSNDGSIAPSQSASQVGYHDSHPPEHTIPSPAKLAAARRAERHMVGAHGNGSVTGSIAEEDEGSSGSDDGESGLVVHENNNNRFNGTRGGPPQVQQRIPAGVPSITAIKPDMRRNVSDSTNNSTAPRRRTQSEVGMGYTPPNAHKRGNLRRTMSGGGSDGSSIQSAKKKGGFFRSIARLFKSSPSNGSTRGSVRGGSVRGGSSGRRGDESPPYGTRSKGGWQTRTEANVRRVGASNRGGGGGGDSSDSDDGMQGRGLVAVTNVGGNKWSVDKVGVAPTPSGKRTSRSDLGAKARSDSASTIVASNQVKKSAAITSSPPGVATNGTVSRSGTVKSTASKRTRQGSITAARTSGSAVGGPSISSIIDKADKPVPGKAASNAGTIKKDDGPKMMEIPKAPKSQTTPQMYQVHAPPAVSSNLLQSPPPIAATIPPVKALSPPASTVAAPKATTNGNGGLSGLNLGAPIGSSDDDRVARPASPLPPSRTLSPPVKSSLRPTSPGLSSPPLETAPAPAYLVSAPTSVIPEKTGEPEQQTKAIPQIVRPPVNNRESYATTGTMTDGESIYESAEEDADHSDDDRELAGASTHTPLAGAGIALMSKAVGEDSDSEASDSTAGAGPKYRVVENNRGVPNVPVEEESSPTPPASVAATPKPKAEKPDALVPAAEKSEGGGLERRKSVRMNVPDSPAPTTGGSQMQAAMNMPSRNATSTPTSNGNGTGNGNGNAAAASEWKSKVGQMQDSSDEEDNSAYVKAKKSLTTSTKRFSTLEAASPKKVVKKKSAKRSSVA